MRDEELTAKLQFADNMVRRPGDPQGAARSIVPGNTELMLYMAQHWPYDETVVAEMKAIREENDPMDLLPSKAEFAREVWTRLTARRVDNEDFTKLGKLYADVCGYIDKPQTNVAVMTNSNNKVMVVNQKGTDEEWSKKLIRQQKKLVSAATKK